MKKLLTTVTALAILLTSAVPSLAVLPADESKESKAGYEIVVDGQEIDAQACVLVPVRAVGEALGFTVTWDPALPGARISNDKVYSNLQVDVNSYTVVSNIAIGMSAPFSLSSAPVLIQNTMYVPVELFRCLLGNHPGSVNVNGSTISINTKAESENHTEIPNPFTEHASLAELTKAVGFAVTEPQLPEGYSRILIQDVDGELAELRYSDGENTITYRVSRGDADNSGNYNVYKESQTLKIKDISVLCRGDNGICLATWTHGGFSYSISSTASFTTSQITQIVESILNA